MVIRFPCKVCNKTSFYGSDSIQCSKCDIWLHRKCNGLNKQVFEHLKKKMNLNGSVCFVLVDYFIEIINSNKRKILVGCVYRHPSMEVNQFNSLFLNTITEKLLAEKNKEIVLLGDLSINLLKYEKDHNAADFLDQIYSTSLVPHITSPTRITSFPRTLIDNIF